MTDSSTSFWMRTSATSGIVTVAQARDGTSAGQLWDLVYDAGARAFSLFPYESSGSVELTTGPNAVASANAWVQVEVRYNAATDGGARLYVGGQTQPSWGVTGDFSHSSDYRILQLWNDGGPATFDFDDVSVARPSGAVAPGAPTAVSGHPGDGSVALAWTAPSDDGGAAITSYRITPYAGTTAHDRRRHGVGEHVARPSRASRTGPPTRSRWRRRTRPGPARTPERAPR